MKEATKPFAVIYVRSWAPWETDSLERTKSEASQWGEAYRACLAKIDELGAELITDDNDYEFSDHEPGDTLDRERLRDLLSFVAGRFDIAYVVIHCADCLSTDPKQRARLLRILRASAKVVFVHNGDNIPHYGDDRRVRSAA